MMARLRMDDDVADGAEAILRTAAFKVSGKHNDNEVAIELEAVLNILKAARGRKHTNVTMSDAKAIFRSAKEHSRYATT